QAGGTGQAVGSSVGGLDGIDVVNVAHRLTGIGLALPRWVAIHLRHPLVGIVLVGCLLLHGVGFALQGAVGVVGVVHGTALGRGDGHQPLGGGVVLEGARLRAAARHGRLGQVVQRVVLVGGHEVGAV